MWKNNARAVNSEIRRGPIYDRWRKAVVRRDGACRICGSKKDLHAHHIKEFATHPKLRFVVSNGLTVCRPCHEKIHGWRIFS